MSYTFEELLRFCEINNNFHLIEFANLIESEIDLALKYPDTFKMLAQLSKLNNKQVKILLANSKYNYIKYCLIENKNIDIKIKTKIIRDAIKKEIFK